MKNLSNHQLWTLIETETPSFTLSFSLSFSTRSLSLTFNCEYFHHKSLQNPSLFVAFWVTESFGVLSLSRRAPNASGNFLTQIWAENCAVSSLQIQRWLIEVSLRLFRHFRVSFCWFHSMIKQVGWFSRFLCSIMCQWIFVFRCMFLTMDW